MPDIAPAPHRADAPLLVADAIERVFRTRRGRIHAVDGVSLTINDGEAVALVGESGSGKTTLAGILVGLDSPTSGSIHFRGFDLRRDRKLVRTALHEKVSMVFQDPYASIDSRLPVWRSVEEPLAVHGRGTREERRRMVDNLLDSVGLDPAFGHRRPTALSGGQRQRAAIARAIALGPELVVLDEPVSALDVSVQAQVLNLLRDLREQSRMAYLFVSHDLAVVRHIADRVAVMYLGKLVEVGETEQIFAHPTHPYTIALLSSAADLGTTSDRIMLDGDPPSPSDPPSGCRFHTRCFRAKERCASEEPALRVVDGREVACHFPGPVTSAERRQSRSMTTRPQ